MTDSDRNLPLEEIPAALLDAVGRAVGPWIRSRVTSLAADRMTAATIDGVVAEVTRTATTELATLLALDVDEQRSNPLHVLRSASRVATDAMRAAGVPPVARDAVESEAMPDDIYAIGPLTWRDLSDDVHEAGITWGAWKAAVVISRHRSAGKDPS